MAAPVDREFFVVAAQIIPVLLLAGLVEYRGEPEPASAGAPRQRLDGPERKLAIERLVMVVGLIWGEVAALVAIAGRPTITQRHLVVAGLAAGAFALVDRVVGRELDRLAPMMRRRSFVATVITFSIAIIGVVLAAVIGSLFWALDRA